jgi:hypothetical protein
MKLQSLSICSTNVDDLSPLKAMPLETAWVHCTRVRDLSPLSASPLKTLAVPGEYAADLAPLRDLPVEVIDVTPVGGPYNPAHLKVLRAMPALKTINGKPAADFWKAVEAVEKAGPGG